MITPKDELRLPIKDEHGQVLLYIRRHLAKGRAPELRGASEVPTLAEGTRYEYAFELGSEEIVGIQPSEVFLPSATSLASGLIETGWAVGIVSVTATTASGRQLRGSFDVRAAKFSDEEDFAAMLNDLTQVAVEALHLGFAPSMGQYQAALQGAPKLDYQRFAVLHSLLRSGELRRALEFIAAHPHRSWATTYETRRPGQPMKGSSILGRQFVHAQRRVEAPGFRLRTLPAELTTERTEETFDNVPNRWVRGVLEEWRDLAGRVRQGGARLGTGPAARAENEAAWVIEVLDEVLGTPAWMSVGPLRQSVGDNFVLRRGQGYRAVTSASVIVDMALQLHVDEDPFQVSRRSVATLYEYWTFVRLALAVAESFGTSAPFDQLFRQDQFGLSLALKTGRSNALQFSGRVRGVAVTAELFFNRTFGAGASWTSQMRPDASLVVRDARGGGVGVGPATSDLWVHFDAKYKVDWLDALELDETDEDSPEGIRAGEAKRSDLLKMHAYKDAVYGSAGAYVLFPGTRHRTFEETAEDEALPGIGAFGLRPASAEADTAELAMFITRLMEHVVRRGTRHARLERWTVSAMQGDATTSFAPLPPGESRPPQDTPVMCGYVRSSEQRAWINARHWYNVRADDRPGSQEESSDHLQAQWLILYGKIGPVQLYRRLGGWTIMSREDLSDLGYPGPRGRAYFVCKVERVEGYDWVSTISSADLLQLSKHSPGGFMRPGDRPLGAPFSTTWLHVMQAAEYARGAD